MRMNSGPARQQEISAVELRAKLLDMRRISRRILSRQIHFMDNCARGNAAVFGGSVEDKSEGNGGKNEGEKSIHYNY